MAKVAKTVKDLYSNGAHSLSRELLNYDFSELINLVGSEDLISELISYIYKTDRFAYYEYCKIFETLKTIFVSCKFNKEDIRDLNTFKEISKIFVKNFNYLSLGRLETIIKSFNDKHLVLEYLDTVFNGKIEFELDATSEDYEEHVTELINYLIKARPYFVDDRAFIASAINVINDAPYDVLRYGDSKATEEYVDSKVKEAKKVCGIYDVDEISLKEVDRKLDKVISENKKLDNSLEIADSKIKEIEELVRKAIDDIVSVRIDELTKLKQEVINLTKSFNEAYEQILAEEKASLIKEKDLLLADINLEIQKKASMLEGVHSRVNLLVQSELSRITNFSNESLEKLKSFIENDETVKRMLSDAKTDSELMERLAKVEILAASQGITVTTSKENEPSIVIPNIVLPKKERVLDRTVNYFFDDKIPFETRYRQLLELKQKDIEENGAIYHEKFNQLLTMVIENETPYMYGPSGCGKTYMVQKQLSKLLNEDVITSGYIQFEQDVIGYRNSATGQYVPTNLYNCHKYGDIIFLDELDNSISSATIVLNPFLCGNKDDIYTFPHGEQVKRHPNFRVICAGNTKGTGRTVAHNTRQRIEESVMQRITPIEIGYDNRIEEQILKDYPDWYNFFINVREAIKKTHTDTYEGENYTGTLTTRDAQNIKKYKDHNSFTDEELIQFEIIENKDQDTLSQIESELENLSDNLTDGAKVLFKKYKKITHKDRDI